MRQHKGLETIAESFMGRRQWHKYQESFLHKLQRLDAVTMEDWRPPNASDPCSLRLCHEFPTRTSSECESISSSVSSNDETSLNNNNNNITINKEDEESSLDHSTNHLEEQTTNLNLIKSTNAQNLSNAQSLSRKESLGSPKQSSTPTPSRSPSVSVTCNTPTPVPSGATDLPLDLSAKPSSEDAGSCTSRSSSPTIEQRLQALAGVRHPLQLNKLGLVDTASLLQDHFKPKPPVIHHRSSTVAGRRTYTEEGLQAALRAIQDGKLGTRRAAVLYGIPRSTLRNKVYKLALERGRDSNLLSRSPSVVSSVPPDDKEMLDDDDEDRDSTDEAEEKMGVPKSLNFKEDLIRLSQDPSNADSLRLLLECGSKQVRSGDDDSPSPPSYPPVYPPDFWPGMDPTAYLTQFISASVSSGNLNALSAAALLNPFLLGAPRRASPEDKFPSDQPPPEFLPKMSPLPEILRKIMTEEQHKQQKERQLPFNGSGPSTSVISSDNKNSRDPTGSNVILNVPSFRPKNGDESSQRSPTRSESSSPTGSVGKMGIHLRDVIANSINQKFNQPAEPSQWNMEMNLKRGPPFTPPIIRERDSNHFDDRKLFSPGGKSPLMGHIPGSSSPANHGVGGKGTRPKRGKYRNYNRDALVEAVRAVQRGEMSVHRAGSHFGVPHSTLEYKVKERHLMRPRKREPKPQNNDDLKRKEEGLLRVQPPMPDKSKLTSPLKQTPKHVGAMLPGTPNGLKMPPMFDSALRFPGAPPFPFWPPNPFHHPLSLDFQRGPNFTPTPEQFFASQMMQRIHEETAASGASPVISALGKNAREVAESLYDGSPNGSFLDGIIRSSLETGLSAKQREEQSSNKTLLEQLCRNNRLSEPHRVDHSSSEDELSHSNNNNNRTRSPAAESPHSRHEESDYDVKPTSDEISACDKVDNEVETKKEVEESEVKVKSEEDIKMETD
ncbi:hypothetical protein M8J76_013996 [Diaphorina citri]|nr:hypothetical protein M8J76_013996 [Diaphorina citri]